MQKAYSVNRSMKSSNLEFDVKSVNFISADGLGSENVERSVERAKSLISTRESEEQGISVNSIKKMPSNSKVFGTLNNNVINREKNMDSIVSINMHNI